MLSLFKVIVLNLVNITTTTTTFRSSIARATYIDIIGI